MEKECFDSQVGRLGREADLKGLWRIVHIDVEKDSQVGAQWLLFVKIMNIWRHEKLL